MRIFLILIVFISVNCFSQVNYLNSDGTISDEGIREVFLETFKSASEGDSMFDIEDDYFVVITKYDLNNDSFELSKIKNIALMSSFNQLLNEVRSFQRMGFREFRKSKFNGIIFKTNTIYEQDTRRYYFKFSIYELESLPEHIDMEDLYNFVVSENNNKNIIHVKNR